MVGSLRTWGWTVLQQVNLHKHLRLPTHVGVIRAIRMGGVFFGLNSAVEFRREVASVKD